MCPPLFSSPDPGCSPNVLTCCYLEHVVGEVSESPDPDLSALCVLTKCVCGVSVQRCVYERVQSVNCDIFVCVCDSSFHHEHAVISHCLLCLLVTVTPGYFCCRGIYTSSPLLLSHSISFTLHPSIHPCVQLSVSIFNHSSSLCIFIQILYVCVCECVEMNLTALIDVSLVRVPHVCVMLPSLTTKQDLANPWSQY